MVFFCSIPCRACCPAEHRGGKYNRVARCWIGLGGSPELELIKIDSFRGGDELERCCYRCRQARVRGANYLPAAAPFPRPPQPPALTPAQGQILEKIDRGLVAPASAFAPRGSSLLELHGENHSEKKRIWAGAGGAQSLGPIRGCRASSAFSDLHPGARGKMKRNGNAFFSEK